MDRQMWNVIGLLLILMRTIMEAVYYWHPLYLHIISTGFCRLILCIVGAVCQPSKGRWVYPQEEYPIHLRLILRSSKRGVTSFNFAWRYQQPSSWGFYFQNFWAWEIYFFSVYSKLILNFTFCAFWSCNGRREGKVS